MTEANSPEMGFSIETLLVRQVSGLVTATAQLIAENTGGDSLEAEAQLHRLLAISCEKAAQSAQELAMDGADEEGLPANHEEGEVKQL